MRTVLCFFGIHQWKPDVEFVDGGGREVHFCKRGCWVTRRRIPGGKWERP